MSKSPYIVRVTALGAMLLSTSLHAAPAAFQYKVWAPGVRASIAAPSPTPSVGAATGLLEALDSTDFGTVLVGHSTVRTFRFTNIGSLEAQGIRAAVGNGDIRMASNSCGTAEALATVLPGATCDVTVEYAPLSAGPLQGTLVVGGAFANAPTALQLTGHGEAQAIGRLEYSSRDFGQVALNTSAVRSFTFKNVGTAPATNVSAEIANVTGLTVSGNTCGTSAAPVTVPGGGSCAVTLTYGGAKASKLLSTPLRINGNFTGGPSEVLLAGILGGFDAVAAWTMSSSPLTAPSEAWKTYGTLAVGENSSEKTLMLRNSGTNGGIGASFVLSGDTQHFAITRVYALNSAGNSEKTCLGGKIAQDKLSAEACETSGALDLLALRVAYAPKSVGTHSVTVTPVSSNGADMPGGLALNGNGQFNPRAEWSTYHDGVVAPTASTLSYGSRTPGSTLSKSLFVRNQGTHGSMGIGFQLSGDTRQFRIRQISYVATSNGTETGTCAVGSGTVTEICLAGAYRQLRLAVEYTPTESGNHTMTLTPATNNGTILPEPITLSGTGLFNATGAWSMKYDGLVAPTPAWLSFGTRALNSPATKEIWLRNIGTNGPLAAAFSLSGDVEHFRIKSLIFQRSNLSGEGGGCSVLDGKDTSMCEAADTQGGGYTQIVVRMEYSPKATGNHQVVLNTRSSNGTSLPAPVTFTGQGQ